MKAKVVWVTAISLVTLGVLMLCGFSSAMENQGSGVMASARLKSLEPNDISSIEIFRLEEENGQTKRRFAGHPGEDQMAEAIKGILALCKKASKYQRPEGLVPYFASHVMVVKLANSDTLEIPYNSRFEAPFGELESAELKQAIYALTNGGRGVLIHVDEGKVLDVTTFRTARAGQGSHASAGWEASINLDANGQLRLNLLTRKDRKIIMQDSQPMQYGKAQIYDYDGPGLMIVHLYLPEWTG